MSNFPFTLTRRDAVLALPAVLACARHAHARENGDQAPCPAEDRQAKRHVCVLIDRTIRIVPEIVTDFPAQLARSLRPGDRCTFTLFGGPLAPMTVGWQVHAGPSRWQASPRTIRIALQCEQRIRGDCTAFAAKALEAQPQTRGPSPILETLAWAAADWKRGQARVVAILVSDGCQMSPLGRWERNGRGLDLPRAGQMEALVPPELIGAKPSRVVHLQLGTDGGLPRPAAEMLGLQRLWQEIYRLMGAGEVEFGSPGLAASGLA